MDKQELQQTLVSLKIPPDVYSLEGGLPNDMWVLDQRQTGWSVYFSERGSKFDEAFFLSESEACEYFLIKINRMMRYY